MARLVVLGTATVGGLVYMGRGPAGDAAMGTVEETQPMVGGSAL